MGAGKTLLASLAALKYSKDTNNPIFSNYKLNLPNATYTPYGFMPFGKFKNCLIVFDDIATVMNTLSGFASLVVNASRKNNVNVIFTGQYYTQLPKYLRSLSLLVQPRYNKKNDELLYIVSKQPIPDAQQIDDPSLYHIHGIRNAVATAKAHKLYDTYQIVEPTNIIRIREEILKFSTDYEDMKANVCLWQAKPTAQLRELKALDKMIEDGYVIGK